MSETLIIYIILFVVMLFQTVIGVGVLVIGTPVLLLLGINLVETISILLPISIATSFFNLIYFFLKRNISLNIIEKDTKNYFFIYCMPCILLGLYILKLTSEFLNFNYIVGSVIILSVLITKKSNFLEKVNKLSKILFLSLVGTIHGLTNSGGSLLSIFLSNRNNKINSRYNITFFYFFLASFQFISFLSIFGLKVINTNFIWAIIFCPITVFLGNFAHKKISEKIFREIVITIAIITSISLFIK